MENALEPIFYWIFC